MPFGGTEMIVVMVVLLLLFGSTWLPKLARSVGEARKEPRDAVAEEDH